MSSEERHALLVESWDMYYEVLFRFSFLLTSDADATRSIIVESFMSLYRMLDGGIEGDNNVKSFLYATVRDKSLYFLKYHPVL